MFAAHHGNRNIKKGKEVWICDETSKLGNRPFIEFLKMAAREKVQVIFCGDTKQISSIDRGGIFTYLQEKYGAQTLKDIQRQKQGEQRYVSKALATGRVGAAFNAIESMKGFVWSNSKKEAIQSLFEEWAKDCLSHPQSNTLMIAHSNAIVSTLNELARTARKARGELSTQEEFCCETKFGKIYVSPGDRIQFRKKDFDLGITNGLVGVVTKAKESKFTVLIDQGGKFKRKITFNPQKYNAFQLGYATTYFRSQGNTVDRCYVLDSPHLNKENFYVALTRHVNKVRYFVHRDAVKNLTDLKAKAMKDGSKGCTLHYITNQDIELEQAKEQRETEITGLKQSTEFLAKAKGHFLEIKDSINSGIGKKVQSFTDVQKDKAFFKPIFPDEEKVKASVTKIIGGWDDEPGSPVSTVSGKNNRLLSDVGNSKNDAAKFESILKKEQWKGIGDDGQAAFKGYFKSSKQASNLYQAVKTESEFSSQKLETCLSFPTWQKACAKRNEAAYQIFKEVEQDLAIRILGKQSYKIVQTLSARYEAVLEKDNSRQQAHQGLKEGLEKNAEALLYKLFPEGPVSKRGTQIRFGSKGSLCVNVVGSKAGLFYDHENQEGGDLLKLIQKANGSDRKEAKEWANSFLSIASKIQVPSNYQKPTLDKGDESSWVSIKPPSGIQTPSLKEVNPGLSDYYKEEGRHSYTNEKGQLLYQVLRLRSKQNSSMKMTPPLSYGCDDENKELHWKIKGFKQDGKRPLYNLHELFRNPTKDVLIVEGEKTADKAMEKFPDKDFVCITWSGGASAVSKADWAPLVGRKVVIWPDNDAAGQKAAAVICDEMKQHGVREVYLVENKELFERFPQKWDLADSLPDGLNVKDLERQLYRNKKGGLLESVIGQSKACKDAPIEEFKARHLLFHYEKSTAAVLEEQLKQATSYTEKEELIWKYKQGALNLVESSSEVKKQIAADPLVNAKGEVVEKLATQILIFKAKHSKEPTVREINKMKQVIGQLEKEWGLKAGKNCNKEAFTLAKDSLFEKYCTKALMGVKIDKQDLKISKSEVIEKAGQIAQKLSFQNSSKMVNHQRAIENQKQIGRGIEH